LGNPLRDLWDRPPNWSRRRWIVSAVSVLVMVVVLVAVVRGTGTTKRSQTAVHRPDATEPAFRSGTEPAREPSTGAIAALPAGVEPLAVAPASHESTYARERFGASGWIDDDGDCQNTRAEVLIQESTVPVTFTTGRDCAVATGQWTDPWSGAVSTSAGALDIDHTVPLANAWRSGAWAWTPEQRVAYANDLADLPHLDAILLGENRSKGDAGPEQWRPPSRSAWCAYAQTWTQIKARWQLSATSAEWDAVLELAATC
jgi:hypothetical protein